MHFEKNQRLLQPKGVAPGEEMNSHKRKRCPLMLLEQSWEFVRSLQEGSSGRTLARPTGSRLEAQLLVTMVEAFYDRQREAPPLLTRSAAGIPRLPDPLPGVPEEQWAEFREAAFQ